MTEYKFEELYYNPITIALPDGNKIQLSASGRLLLDGSLELDEGVFVSSHMSGLSVHPHMSNAIRVKVEE